MMALRLHGVGDVRVHDEPAREPGPGELMLRVTAVGLCGSDLHWFAEGAIGDAVLERPLVLGHEPVAVVDDGPRAGERVAVDPAIPCGRCAPCVAGEENLCVAVRFAGHGGTDGALRQLMPWPERCLHPVPDSLTDAEAALLEPLGVALYALELGRVGPGASVGVFGCGPLGLLLVQVLRLAGADVAVATDPLAHRADAARALGAAGVLETRRAGRDALPRRLREGLDVAFDVAGDDDAVATAIDLLRPGGVLVLVGIPTGDRTAFTASVARRKGLSIVLCRRMRGRHLERAITLAGRGDVELASLVSERFPLARGAEAFAALKERRGLKVVVEPQRGAA
jgi:L-iditol 2-dehydrogenase